MFAFLICGKPVQHKELQTQTRARKYLLFKQVALVEKQDNIRVFEPVRVDYLAKQPQRLLHAVGGAVLIELQVVLCAARERRAREWGGESE